MERSITERKTFGRFIGYTKTTSVPHGYDAVKTSYYAGYISRKDGMNEIWEYNGKYGSGYAVLSSNKNSTVYSFVTYYVKDGECE